MGDYHILIVDRDSSLQRIVAIRLKGLGCIIDQVCSVNQAIERMQKTKYSVIFLECEEDVSSNLTLLDCANDDEGKPRVIFIAHKLRHALLNEFFAKGGSRYLGKPLRMESVKGLIVSTVQNANAYDSGYVYE